MVTKKKKTPEKTPLLQAVLGIEFQIVQVTTEISTRLRQRVTQLADVVVHQVPPEEQEAREELEKFHGKQEKRILRTKLKPEKGRIKDLKRLEGLLERLESELLPKSE